MGLYFKITGYFFALMILLGFLGVWAKEYFALGIQPSVNIEPVQVSEIKSDQEFLSVPEYEVVEVFSDLFVPWSIVFEGENRMVIAQRDGVLLQAFVSEQDRIWELAIEPLYKFEEVSQRSEEGLMGLTLDPDFAENRYIYACVAYQAKGEMNIKIERLKDESNVIVEKTTIIDGIPGARFHAGCRIAFGPDDKLYITVGDALEKSLAQNSTVLNGKLLRINSDGTIPADNPIVGSAIWSLGHRNSQGIDWHPESGILVSSEHGPSIIDGPAGGDEINIIAKGENFGWPVVSHKKSDARFVDPALVITPAIAPASGAFYDGKAFSEFYGNYFVGMLSGEGIMRIVFDQEGENVIGFMKLLGIDFGRIREVAVGPDGAIYFSSSNFDGRGSPNSGDDKIYKIVPKS